MVHDETKPSERAAIHLKKTIVSLCFHPYYPNFICALQEGGDIHVIDASNGTVVYEYVAKVKMNSNWAVDKENQRLFVVGDVGKAIVFDMSFVSQFMKSSFTQGFLEKSKDSFSSQSPTKKKVRDFKWKIEK